MGYLAQNLMLTGNPTESPEIKLTMDYISKLHREIFYLWGFIGQEGIWDEAREFVDEHLMMPTPFEYRTKMQDNEARERERNQGNVE